MEESITVHEFGKENPNIIVMYHPLGVWWDVYEYVIKILEKDYHLIIPSIPGLDPDKPESEFTSIEEIEEQITNWLIKNEYSHVKCLFGCSMGGALVIRTLASNRITTDYVVIDAGITPYQLPKIFTYFIGIKDWCMTEIGKHSSVKVLNSVVDTNKFDKNDIIYIKKVLNSMSSKTIWRGFYSTNNYSMPKEIPQPNCPIQYWYGEEEKKAREWDIEYIKKIFPKTVFVENKGQNHAEYFTLYPEEFCKKLKEFIESS
ncbi:hydrolase, alpha/beta fold family [Anaeromyces robustus]|uniref:Hydrolase, alpha/beta fold family n=1 Tax=Anaeromyces robustus TaxID=1754192 RepID=A0A1Y1VX43_9FUNG|nr:hydrolase, alpha/beta fold family [Anaeromyces robustus]|eukprot:ORX65887.1 hydrolase, alpha/beta fold family [Anaeromyces robustus]